MLTIILSVAGGIVAFIILCIVIATIHGKKKEHALDENIKKLKAEKESLKDSGSLTIASDEAPAQTETPEGATIESINIEDNESAKSNEVKNEEDNMQTAHLNHDDMFNIADDKALEDFLKDLDDDFDYKPKKTTKKKKNTDEFEKFLDKHSYTRRILDKDILKKLQELPPEIKAIVISNIFTRPQD